MGAERYKAIFWILLVMAFLTQIGIRQQPGVTRIPLTQLAMFTGPQAQGIGQIPSTPRPDGVKRWEISDQDAVWKKMVSGKLGDIIDHPKLFSAYPQLRDTPVTIINPDLWTADTRAQGFTDANTNPPSITIQGGNSDEMMSTLLHEVQHRIQLMEGFDKGVYATTQTDPRWQNSPGEQEAVETQKRQLMNDQQRTANPPYVR